MDVWCEKKELSDFRVLSLSTGKRGTRDRWGRGEPELGLGPTCGEPIYSVVMSVKQDPMELNLGV